VTVVAGGVSAARPQLIRAINEQVLLDHIRRSGPLSRTELARLSGLSKPTVSSALANIERAGLVHATGQRTGVPGPAAILYEVRPDAGFILGLDVGRQFLRGAVADLAGTVRSRLSVRTKAMNATARVQKLADLATTLLDDAGITASQLTQTVIGSPGVYDPKLDTLTLTGRLSGWDSPAVLAALRDKFGSTLMIENDVAAAFARIRAGRDIGDAGRDYRPGRHAHCRDGPRQLWELRGQRAGLRQERQDRRSTADDEPAGILHRLGVVRRTSYDPFPADLCRSPRTGQCCRCG